MIAVMYIFNIFQLFSSFSSHPLARKYSISLRSANWIPFENGNIGNTKISIDLNGGLAINPFETMLLSEFSSVSSELVRLSSSSSSNQRLEQTISWKTDQNIKVYKSIAL